MQLQARRAAYAADVHMVPAARAARYPPKG
jgi:hypothetical protein